MHYFPSGEKSRGSWICAFKERNPSVVKVSLILVVYKLCFERPTVIVLVPKFKPSRFSWQIT
jgi:hypothetical protein